WQGLRTSAGPRPLAIVIIQCVLFCSTLWPHYFYILYHILILYQYKPASEGHGHWSGLPRQLPGADMSRLHLSGQSSRAVARNPSRLEAEPGRPPPPEGHDLIPVM